MSDAVATIGSVLKDTEIGQRDAIHVAVMSVVARHTLKAGTDVGLFDDGTAGVHDNPVGIVDPFLDRNVKKGEAFWLCVYPRTITSLRHVWSHPNIPDKLAAKSQESDEKVASRQWIDEYANELGFTGDRLIAAAQDYLDHGDYIRGGDEMEGNWTSEEFWDHYEIVTGKKVRNDKRGNFFSCSC